MKKVKKECPSCAMQIDADAKVCPICGYEFPSELKYQWIAAVMLIIIVLYVLYRLL